MENKFKVGDIVRIVRDSVGYSENFIGQECEVTTIIDNRCWVLVTYKNNYYGTHNLMFYGDDLEIVRAGDSNVDIHQTVNEATTKITSTGGSSDYYKLNINGNHVETEDVIYAMVGGDFALGNALKALRRMYLDSEGGGKEGVDMSYDANKVKYFVDSFVKRFGG
jgi:hypothetical protein